MRRLALALILLALPTLAVSADGVAPRRITVVTQPRAPVRPVAPRRAPTAPLPPLLASVLPGGGSQCRTTCAQTRYFCEASSVSDDCGANWGQCVAACSAPNLLPPTVGAN